MPKYFGQAECRLIDTYNLTQNQSLFTSKVYPLLYKLVDGAFARIKYRTMSDAHEQDIIQNVVSRLTQLLPRLDPSKGNYFSYLTMVAQNELRKVNKDFYNETLRVQDIEITNETDIIEAPEDNYDELRHSLEIMITKMNNPLDRFIIQTAIEVFDGVECRKIRGLRTLYSLVQWKTGLPNKRIIRAIMAIRQVRQDDYQGQNIYQIT